MAKIGKAAGAFEQKLIKTLRDGLKFAGLSSTVALERISGTKLRRVLVTSPAFDKLRPSERQDLVWRIVNSKFPQADQLLISMIMTLSPRELGGDEMTPRKVPGGFTYKTSVRRRKPRIAGTQARRKNLSIAE